MGTTPCPRGVLIVPDANHKKPIPFLIMTREEDVIWNKKDIEAVKAKIKSKLSEDDEINIEVLKPKPSYRFHYDGWVCSVDGDCYCTLTKKIKIDDHFVREVSNNGDVFIKRPNIELPFLMKDTLDIQLTKELSLNASYSTTDAFIFGINKNNKGFIESFNIGVQSLYYIPETYVTYFNDCFIYINIHGYLATPYEGD